MLAVGTHEEFLNDLTVHFLDEKRKPKELRLHEVAPLDAKFRAEIGDWQDRLTGYIPIRDLHEAVRHGTHTEKVQQAGRLATGLCAASQ